MRFTKMHGLGNDYVFVDGVGAAWSGSGVAARWAADPAGLARRVADRHTGIGGDGLILILPSERADVRMEMYNADGSRGRMCGNGIRCVAKYAVEHGLVAGPDLAIETDAGVRRAACVPAGGRVERVRIDMGRPSLAPSSLPATIDAERIVDHPITIAGTTYTVTCVSMGNPHAVVFIEPPGPVPHGPHAGDTARDGDPATGTAANQAPGGGTSSRPAPGRTDGGRAASGPGPDRSSRGAPNGWVATGRALQNAPPTSLIAVDLVTVGPEFEHAPVFPERINTHFVRVDSATHVTVRTWERGSGATRACGTGACAVCVAGAVTGRTRRAITVELPGGALDIDWDDDDHVHMTGPAVEVFSGVWRDT
ncbi:MAG: diaminopimelate epimerase [Phycisphaerae bacterium]